MKKLGIAITDMPSAEATWSNVRLRRSAAERVVAAHCHGKAGVMAAVRAGVHTIEHGTYVDAEAARAMADTGTILVPTRFVGDAVLRPDSTVPMPAFAREKLAVTYRAGREAVGHALAAGVTIPAGTDIINSGDQWGRNGGELALLVECGLTPLQAIEAATANAALTVGPQAPDTGRLAAGCVADVIAVGRTRSRTSRYWATRPR